MSVEYTLEDLASSTASKASSAATDAAAEQAAGAATDAAGDNMGEYLWKITEKLDERGYLGPMLGLEDPPGEAPTQQTPDGRSPKMDVPDDAGDTGAASSSSPAVMDSDKVHALLLQIYDAAGQIPMVSDDPTVSELIQLVESHPGAVDQLIEQHL